MNIQPISNGIASPTAASNQANPSPELLIGLPFSATVAGKTFSTEIEHIGDTYAAEVPNLLGASAVDDSVERVEDSLGNLISFFA